MLTPKQTNTAAARKAGGQREGGTNSLQLLWMFTPHELERFTSAVEADVQRRNGAPIQQLPAAWRFKFKDDSQWHYTQSKEHTYGVAFVEPLYTATPPAPAPAPLSEREVFEATWEKLHGKRPALWSKMFAEHKMETPAHCEGRYFGKAEQAAWELWQARAALAAQGNKNA